MKCAPQLHPLHSLPVYLELPFKKGSLNSLFSQKDGGPAPGWDGEGDAGVRLHLGGDAPHQAFVGQLQPDLVDGAGRRVGVDYTSTQNSSMTAALPWLRIVAVMLLVVAVRFCTTRFGAANYPLETRGK